MCWYEQDTFVRGIMRSRWRKEKAGGQTKLLDEDMISAIIVLLIRYIQGLIQGYIVPNMTLTTEHGWCRYACSGILEWVDSRNSVKIEMSQQPGTYS